MDHKETNVGSGSGAAQSKDGHSIQGKGQDSSRNRSDVSHGRVEFVSEQHQQHAHDSLSQPSATGIEVVRSLSQQSKKDVNVAGLNHGQQGPMSISLVRGMHDADITSMESREVEQVAGTLVESHENEPADEASYRRPTWTSKEHIAFPQLKPRPQIHHHGSVQFVPDLHVQDTDPMKSRQDAEQIAEVILDELELDLLHYFGVHDIVLKKGAKDHPSEIGSIKSELKYNTRVYGIDEPSTMDLYYEKKDAGEYRSQSLTPIQSPVDVQVEAKLHRHKSPTETQNKHTQTKEMMLLPNKAQAEIIYRRMYRRADNYKPPLVTSRTASLEGNVVAAKSAPGNVDRVVVGPKVKWSNKPRVLPPLVSQDYHKVETFWTGSTYSGKYVGRQFDKGFYNYPLMSTYESEFEHGVMHTKKHHGLVVYPRGDTFEGKWTNGRFTAGQITFEDGLQYRPDDWDYLKPPNRMYATHGTNIHRTITIGPLMTIDESVLVDVDEIVFSPFRFHIEQDIGVKQVGRTLYSNFIPPLNIPLGMYDTCDGVYDPETRIVSSYNGMKLRLASESEHEYILSNYRQSKVSQDPKFNVNRLPGSYVNQCTAAGY